MQSGLKSGKLLARVEISSFYFYPRCPVNAIHEFGNIFKNACNQIVICILT
jgi:hypothetical protein